MASLGQKFRDMKRRPEWRDHPEVQKKKLRYGRKEGAAPSTKKDDSLVLVETRKEKRNLVHVLKFLFSKSFV